MFKFKLQSKNYLELIFFVSFICIFFIFNRGWFFETNIIMGHNWDFQFPYDHYSQNFNIASNFTWHDNFGNTNLIITHYFLNNTYVFLSKFLSTSLLIKLIYFLVFFSSFYSMRYLIYKLTSSNNWSYLAGLMYAFSPFLFSAVIAGSFPQWIAYAFSPLFFYFLFSYLANGGRLQLLGVLIAHFFVFIFIQYFLLISFLSIIFGVFFYNKEILSYKKIIKRLSILTIVFIFVNLYWLIPFIFQLTDFYNEIYNHESVASGEFNSIRHVKQNLLHIFFNTGFWDRNLYLNSLVGVERIVFIISTFMILFLAFTSDSIGKSSKLFVVFLSFFLFAAFIVKGGNFPFQDITMWIYSNFPLMRMYRTPQNIMFISAFLFPIVISLALYQSSKPKYYFVLFLSTLTFIGWFNTGDIGHRSLGERNLDSLDFYSINDDIKKVYENNTNRKLLHKELFFPSSYSIYYKDNYNQRSAQGQVPEYFYLDKEGVFVEEVDNEKLLELHEQIDKDFLKQNNIRYITIRNDINYFHVKKLMLTYNYYTMKNYLDSEFTKVYESELATTYLVEDFLPPFYVCSNDEYKFSNFKNIEYGFCNIDPNDLSNLNYTNKLIGSNDRPFIEYAKVSPVEYRVNIKGIKDNSLFLLRFFQQFDKYWNLIPLSKNRKVIEKDKSSYLTEINKFDILDKNKERLLKLSNSNKGDFISKVFYNSVQNDNIIEYNSKLFSLESNKIESKFHLPMDEYLIGRNRFDRVNGWIIDMNYMEENFKDFIYFNDDGSFDMEFRLTYFPQQLFRLGLLISLVSFIFFISIFIFYSIKKIIVKKKYS